MILTVTGYIPTSQGPPNMLRAQNPLYMQLNHHFEKPWISHCFIIMMHYPNRDNESIQA